MREALDHSKVVKVSKLNRAFNTTGLETDPLALYAFLRRIDLAPKTGRVVVDDFIHNIKEKQAAWWS